jgi:hypothetical protein
LVIAKNSPYNSILGPVPFVIAEVSESGDWPPEDTLHGQSDVVKYQFCSLTYITSVAIDGVVSSSVVRAGWERFALKK